MSNLKKGVFVSAIDTDIGKTVVSAILVKAMKADYWKPVQAGSLNHTDTHEVLGLSGMDSKGVHTESYALKEPMSPHAAAEREGVQINLNSIELPNSDKPIVVEGAGGLLVPLNDEDTILDLIQSLNLPVILVSKNYLGSINHTLMSLDVLSRRNIKVLGIIMNGDTNSETEEIIEKIGKVRIIYRLPEGELSRTFIESHALEIAKVLEQEL